MSLFFLALGVALLALGAETLIRGALAAAQRFGLSPLLAGLVLVGFGTSAPELVVSVDASLNRRPDIAVGNVVGSNIANVLLILGICALITPLRIKPMALRRDGAAVVAATILFLLLIGRSGLVWSDGLILLVGLAAYLVWAYWSESCRGAAAAEVHRAEAEEVTTLPKPVPFAVAAVVAGLMLLIGGSRLVLTGAVQIAEALGVSEAVIGLTLVAVGTSLPELSISVLAAVRRHADVSVGNVLGSNIFNLLGILGIAALLEPLPVHSRFLLFDQWVMLGSSLIILAFLYTGSYLNRLEGGLLLLSYAVYVGVSFTLFGH